MIQLIQTKDKGFGSFVVIENDLIGRYINHYGFWELHLIGLYRKFIKDTDVVLDAGANIGFHTIHMGHICKKVYAYEPQPMIFNILSTNILFSGLSDKIEHFRLGLGDKKSSAKMEPLDRFNEADGTRNFGGRGLSQDGTGEESVNLIDFDSLDIDIDVIKIDIQGFELYAFMGMQNTLKRCAPWIMLENYVGNSRDEKVLELLQSLGYEIYRPKDNTLPNEDCICIHKENEKHIPIRELLNSELETVFKLI